MGAPVRSTASLPVRLPDLLGVPKGAGMTVPVTSEAVGHMVCSALGLDPTMVRTLTLRLAVDRAVTVEVEQYVHDAAMGRLLPVLKRYTLAERK